MSPFDAPLLNVSAGPVAGGVAAPQALEDPFGRSIRYLRVSVTDRCDLRCLYCMPEKMHFLPKAEVLTIEEPGPALRRLHRAGGEEAPADRRRAPDAARLRGPA